MAEDDFALKWHWEGDRRACDHCHGTVWIFEEGACCSQCDRAEDEDD